MTGKADRDQIRRQNRGIILQALRRAGPLARIELGRATGLSPATVSAITSDLIEEGLVGEWNEGPNEAIPDQGAIRGRPRTALALDPNAACVLGVKIALGKVELILADFAGRHLRRSLVTIDTAGASRTSFPLLLVDAIAAFLGCTDATRPALAEIAVAAQGFVDARAGSIVWSPAFSVRDIAVVEPLMRAFSVPCSLSNDANMIAEALHGRDPAHYGGTFAVVFMDYGVGMGLYLDNRLFTGETGGAAEFGHANHVPGGRLCRCGKHGCLEAYLGDYAIARAAEALPDDHDPWALDIDAETVPALMARAEAGDGPALSAFREAGRALGYGIARLVALIDPRLVALTGSGMHAFPLMESAMNAALEEALVEDLRRGLTIEPHSSQEDLIGAGILSAALRRLDREIFSAPRRTMHDDIRA